MQRFKTEDMRNLHLSSIPKPNAPALQICYIRRKKLARPKIIVAAETLSSNNSPEFIYLIRSRARLPLLNHIQSSYRIPVMVPGTVTQVLDKLLYLPRPFLGPWISHDPSQLTGPIRVHSSRDFRQTVGGSVFGRNFFPTAFILE